MTLITLSPSDHRPGSMPADWASDPIENILQDKTLGRAEKRSLLSSWASDAHAVRDQPWLRHVPGHQGRVRLAAILNALRRLDDDEPPPRGGAVIRLPARRRQPVDEAAWARPMRDPVRIERRSQLNRMSA